MVLSKEPKTFEIELRDPSKAVYSGGDKVTGVVLVEVSEVTRVAAVSLRAVGRARVRYTKGTRRLEEAIDYLRYQDVLHLDGCPTEPDGCVTLRPGLRYRYTFGFGLPQTGQLVSSYRSRFGSVQYSVKAVMERPGRADVQTTKSFEVLEPIDVNSPELTSPVAGFKEKRLTCMFVPDGSVSIAARAERRGYCAGESIRVDAEFENGCSRIVVPKAAIVATRTYLAGGRVKVLREKLSVVRGDHIISGMCAVWRGRAVRVPILKPTVLGCDIIHMDYALMIYLHVPGSSKLALELPLVIGTVPFSASRTNSVSSSQGSVPSAPPSYSQIPRHGDADSLGTPLLDDCDEDDGPIFMRHAPPPAYTEVDEGRDGTRVALRPR